MSRFPLHESSQRRFATDHELAPPARTLQAFNICDGQRGKLAGVPPEGTNHSMCQASSPVEDSPRSTSHRRGGGGVLTGRTMWMHDTENGNNPKHRQPVPFEHAGLMY